MSKIVFTGGGTAGHYSPNLAIISFLKGEEDEIYYIGSKNGPEKEAVERMDIPYFGITCVKLIRSLSPKNALIPFRLLKGINEAKQILKRIDPDIVFSKGGYVALPVAIASSQLKIPLITHESDLSVGLANKIALKKSTLVLTSFDKTAKNIEGAIAVGTPVRPELFIPRDKNAIIEKYKLDKNKKTLLITGGSQGSKAINDCVQKCVHRLINRYNVVHLCGKGKLVESNLKGYITMEFCQDIGELFAVCDLAVSRAGANTLFELIALRIPTLAIPLPKGNSRGDQVENANYFHDKGLIALLTEENLTPQTLYDAIATLDKNSTKIKERCKKENYSENAQKIVSEIKKYRRNICKN